MKNDIHPKYHQATFSCECGNTFTVGSTIPTFHTELCAKCHPFYTGQQKIVDTARRVEKFNTRNSKATKTVSKRVKKEAVKAKKQPKVIEEKELNKK